MQKYCICEIPGDQPLHEESWAGPQRDTNPAAGKGPACDNVLTKSDFQAGSFQKIPEGTRENGFQIFLFYTELQSNYVHLRLRLWGGVKTKQ